MIAWNVFVPLAPGGAEMLGPAMGSLNSEIIHRLKASLERKFDETAGKQLGAA
jgi:hypothetical protein